MEETGKKTQDSGRHCAEVEELMKGKPPFVTRHGVTAVIAVITIAMALLFMMDGDSGELIRGMAEHIIQRLSATTEIPGST